MPDQAVDSKSLALDTVANRVGAIATGSRVVSGGVVSSRFKNAGLSCARTDWRENLPKPVEMRTVDSGGYEDRGPLDSAGAIKNPSSYPRRFLARDGCFR
jgi:hypothetical protein